LPTPGPTGPLKIFADVTVKGGFNAAETGLTVAQGPDGAIFVAGPVTAPQIIWVVDGVRPAGIAEHVKGPVTALAADTANLYVGVGQAVTDYSRTTGNVVRTWQTALPGTLTQLVVVGNRRKLDRGAGWSRRTRPVVSCSGANGDRLLGHVLNRGRRIGRLLRD
jgi:hypothetical protein